MQRKFLFAKVMKNMTGGILFILVALTTLVIYGGLLAPGVARADVAVKQNPSNPTFKVTVADAGGKVAFKGMTDTSGSFATGNLAAGNYVVQLNSSTGATKGDQYTVVIAAGKKKVSAESVAGEKFNAGGVAMKIDVAGGLKVTGQVAASTVKIDEKTKKKLVYIPSRIGSNLPGRWVPADSAEAIAALNSGLIRKEDVSKWQDHGDYSKSTGN